jgi:hypothetical protein
MNNSSTIGLFVVGVILLFLLAGLTQLANWYVRSGAMFYVFWVFFGSLFLSALLYKRYRKLSEYIGMSGMLLIFMHIFLSVSAH